MGWLFTSVSVGVRLSQIDFFAPSRLRVDPSPAAGRYSAVMDSQPDERTLHDGKYIRLVAQGKWEFARRKNTSGIVGIVAVTDDGRLLLVEQFRPPVGKPVIELPAGLAGDVSGAEGEALADAARRELLEETGYSAREMDAVAAGPPSAGMSDEVITLFVARGLTKTGDGAGDGSEQITLHEIPVADVHAFVERKAAEGCLVDLKVFAGLYFVGAPGRKN